MLRSDRNREFPWLEPCLHESAKRTDHLVIDLRTPAITLCAKERASAVAAGRCGSELRAVLGAECSVRVLCWAMRATYIMSRSRKCKILDVHAE